ncbi:MAG: hypothetical protein PHU33_16530, partial [Bacteroidales bacterium]|nr:hypothetical protein [Bacteroidales bacterium]
MKTKLTFLLTTLLLIVSSTTNAQSWQLVGSYFSQFGALSTSATIDQSGTIVTVFQASNKPQASRFSGVNWVSMGSSYQISQSTPKSTCSAVDASGTVYAAYINQSDGHRVEVKKFDNELNDWVFAGSETFSGSGNDYTSLAFDQNGVLHLAYMDGTNSNKLIVKKLTTDWETVGNAGISAGAAYYIDLAIDESNNLFVAYTDAANGNKASVMKYNGTTWDQVGTAGFSEGEVNSTTIALDASGMPYVAYTDVQNGSKATVMKYDGANWTSIGTAISEGTSNYPMIVISPENIPHLTFTDQFYSYAVIIKKYSGGSWTDLTSPDLGSCYSPFITFDAAGQLFAAYTKNSYAIMKCYTGCNNPVDGGTVGSDQGLIAGDIPEPFTSITNPTGYSGVIQYKWQKSSTSNSAGFSDISGATNSFYAETSAPSQTTWYKRLSKVTCESSWLESNTIQVSVISPSWELVGSRGFTNVKTEYNAIAVDNNGTPYVAFIRSNKIWVMKYVGTTWEYVGCTLATSVVSSSGAFVSLAINASNIPYLAYQSTSGNYRANVLKFNGTTWEQVGSANFTPGKAYELSLAIDNTDTPHLAFQDQNVTGSKASVMKYNGSSWVNVGSSGFSAGLASSLSLAFDNTNQPWVAYKDGSISSKVTVQKYNGTSWGLVGTAGFSYNTSTYISLKINSSGTPYVGFIQTSKPSVMTYNGTSWVYTGGSSNPTYLVSSGTSSYTSLAIDPDGVPYLVFKDGSNGGKATVKKYPGTNTASYSNVGSAGFTEGSVYNTCITIDASGTPYVFYQDYNYSEGSYGTVMKYGLPCTNPTNGGVIAQSQTIYIGTQPNPLTSIALPSGHTGELEYKWQQSTEGNSTGFSDIASSNSATFAPGTLSTTTWYKRLAKATCASDWTGAVESNVVEITTIPMPLTYTWNGSSNSDWNTAANWDLNAVPTADDEVVIANAGTAPVITSSNQITCASLTVNSGASLTIESGGSLITNSADGTVTVKRMLSGLNQYHFLSSPVNNADLATIFDEGYQMEIYLRRFDEPTGNWVNLEIPAYLSNGTGYS